MSEEAVGSFGALAALLIVQAALLDLLRQERLAAALGAHLLAIALFGLAMYRIFAA